MLVFFFLIFAFWSKFRTFFRWVDGHTGHQSNYMNIREAVKEKLGLNQPTIFLFTFIMKIEAFSHTEASSAALFIKNYQKKWIKVPLKPVRYALLLPRALLVRSSVMAMWAWISSSISPSVAHRSISQYFLSRHSISSSSWTLVLKYQILISSRSPSSSLLSPDGERLFKTTTKHIQESAKDLFFIICMMLMQGLKPFWTSFALKQ